MRGNPSKVGVSISKLGNDIYNLTVRRMKKFNIQNQKPNDLGNLDNKLPQPLFYGKQIRIKNSYLVVCMKSYL